MRGVRVWLLLFPLLCPREAIRSQAVATGTQGWVEKLLGQIGGRDTWARARGFHMVEILKSERYPQPAVREYWVDFTEPRIMEKTVTGGVNQLQALNGNVGWRVRNGAQEAWTEATVNGWRGFWPGIPTRVFHLLAARDPSVEVRALRPDRMDIYVNGRFALWLATSEEGVPLAYGRQESHLETHFLGRMRQYGSVKLWDAAYEPGDAWQVEMIEYRLFDRVPAVSFAPPRNGHTDPDPTS